MVILLTGQTPITCDPERPEILPVSTTQQTNKQTMSDMEGNARPDRPWTMYLVMLCILCMNIETIVKSANCNPLSTICMSNIPYHGGDLNKLMPLVTTVALEYIKIICMKAEICSIRSVMITPVRNVKKLKSPCCIHVSLRKSVNSLMQTLCNRLNCKKSSKTHQCYFFNNFLRILTCHSIALIWLHFALYIVMIMMTAI